MKIPVENDQHLSAVKETARENIKSVGVTYEDSTEKDILNESLTGNQVDDILNDMTISAEIEIKPT